MPVKDPFQKVYDTTGHQGWAYPDEHERATAVRPKPGDKLRGAIGDTAFEVLTDLAGAGVPARGGKYVKFIADAISGAKHMPFQNGGSAPPPAEHTLSNPSPAMTQRSADLNAPAVPTQGIEPTPPHPAGWWRRRRGT